MTTQIDPAILTRAQAWLDGNYDQETKDEIKNMIENNPTELVDSFYRDLELPLSNLNFQNYYRLSRLYQHKESLNYLDIHASIKLSGFCI